MVIHRTGFSKAEKTSYSHLDKEKDRIGQAINLADLTDRQCLTLLTGVWIIIKGTDGFCNAFLVTLEWVIFSIKVRWCEIRITMDALASSAYLKRTS